VKAANRVVEPAVRRRRWPAVLALVVTAASAAGVAAWIFWWPQELCRRWEARVAAADDRALPAAVEGLDRCGRYAVRPLVGLLASSNPAAVDAGEAALVQRIGRIRAGGDEAWNDAAELAESLHAALDFAPVESQPRYVRLAMALLEAAGRLSMDQRANDPARGRVTAACEIVLRNAQAGVEPERFVARQAAPLKPASRSTGAVRQVVSESSPAEFNPAASGGPSGPILPAPSPLPTAIPAAPVAPPQELEPATPLPRTAANASARVNPIRRADSSEIRQTVAVRSSVGPDNGSEVPSVALASRTAWSLFADLAGGGPAASPAHAELHRRGFRPAEVELGRQFADAEPAERVRLAESLPLQSGIDVRPWLVHLADDEDPLVRLAVVTIMATTNDPQMLARLRQIAISDADEAVRFRARKLTDTGRTFR
jgi:hypothetical protein